MWISRDERFETSNAESNKTSIKVRLTERRDEANIKWDRWRKCFETSEAENHKTIMNVRLHNLLMPKWAYFFIYVLHNYVIISHLRCDMRQQDSEKTLYLSVCFLPWLSCILNIANQLWSPRLHSRDMFVDCDIKYRSQNIKYKCYFSAFLWSVLFAYSCVKKKSNGA